jgi:hypothetical protein
VNKELQKNLPPIQGFTDIPLVSLNEAIVPLKTFMPDIKLMVETIEFYYVEIEDGLTRDESNSITLYLLELQPMTGSLYYHLNKALRSENRQELKPWFLYLRLILTALSHIPQTPLIVYRGINMDLTDKYLEGSTVVWWGFSSCMKRNNLLEKKLCLNKTGKITLFVIKCYSAKDIHRYLLYENQDEVLLPPARRFNVIKSLRESEELQIIELNEIEPAFDFFMLPSSIDVLSSHPTHNIQFQPISTVSLSKKLFPAAHSNRNLEEFIDYLKQHSNADLKGIHLTDSDMDIVVNEIVIKRQCLELNIFSRNVTFNGILTLAHALKKNKAS